METKDITNFTLWQKNLIDFFWSCKSKKNNFLEELSTKHPNYDYDSNMEDEEKKRIESALLSRMKNYGRKSTDNSGVSRYSRSPYLDDLFALCVSQNISPNDILFDSLNCEVESWSSFEDIYFFLKRITKADEIFNIFAIEKTDFSIIKEKIPKDKRFRLAFFYYILCDFVDTFQIQKNSSGAKKLIHYEYKDKIALNYVTKTINFLNCSGIDYIVNEPLLSYSLCHVKWDYFLLEDSDQNKGFAELDCRTYSVWSVKKHFLISLNYFLLASAIKALHTISRLDCISEENINEEKIFNESLSEHNSIRLFIRELFEHSFIKINQSSAIDWNGTIYPEDYDDEMPTLKAHHEKNFSESENSLIAKLNAIKNQTHER